MFEPKHLYTVKNYYWLVFPTKEGRVQAVASGVGARTPGATVAAESASLLAGYWTRELGCLVTWIDPGSNFMVLEVDGKFVKILGDRVGWIVADTNLDTIADCFEEICQ